MKDEYIYVAAPYTSGDTARESTVDRRYFEVTAMAAHLSKIGHVVFSPITLGHAMTSVGLKKPHSWWMDWCLTFLHDAAALYVLEADGWQTSKGVRQEIDVAKVRNIPIVYVKPDANVIKRAVEAFD